MNRQHQSNYRPRILDYLEDRAVPSTLTVSAAAATTATSLQTELTQVGAQVNDVYSSFASSVRQAETTLLAPTTTGATAAATASTVAAQVAQEVNSLASGLLAAINGTTTAKGLTAQTPAGQLLQAEIAGTGSGSLSSSLAAILAVAPSGSTDGTVPQSSLPLLFEAVDSAIAASYSATVVQIYLFAAGQNGSTTSSSGTSTSSFNLTQFGTQVTAAYSSLATNIRQSESTLLAGTGTTSAGTTAATGTATTVSTVIEQQVGILSENLGSTLALTPAAANTSLLQGVLVGSDPNNLTSQLTGLVNTPASGNVVPTAALPLLFAAVDAALAASLTAAAGDGYLLATSPIYSVTTPATTTTKTATTTTGTTSSGTTSTGTAATSGNSSATTSGGATSNTSTTTSGGTSGGTSGTTGTTGVSIPVASGSGGTATNGGTAANSGNGTIINGGTNTTTTGGSTNAGSGTTVGNGGTTNTNGGSTTTTSGTTSGSTTSGSSGTLSGPITGGASTGGV